MKRIRVISFEGEALTPFKAPLIFAFFINKLRTSTTSKKRKGDKGQPYLRPREAQKESEGELFIKIVN